MITHPPAEELDIMCPASEKGDQMSLHFTEIDGTLILASVATLGDG